MEKLLHLERIRKEKGFTREELAKLSGVKAVSIYHLEKGITQVENVKISTLIKLAKSLHCKAIDFIDSDLRRYIA